MIVSKINSVMTNVCYVIKLEYCLNGNLKPAATLTCGPGLPVGPTKPIAPGDPIDPCGPDGPAGPVFPCSPRSP